jgi:hypothetical protein
MSDKFKHELQVLEAFAKRLCAADSPEALVRDGVRIYDTIDRIRDLVGKSIAWPPIHATEEKV